MRYRFKRVWRDGSVAVEFDPIDFVGELAALVPRPRSNLVRYHGCLAPHASLRAYVVKDGRGPPPSKADRGRPATVAESDRGRGLGGLAQSERASERASSSTAGQPGAVPIAESVWALAGGSGGAWVSDEAVALAVVGEIDAAGLSAYRAR